MRSIDSILRAAADGERMTPENALRLFEECQDLSALGKAADSVTRRLHPEPYRTYNIDRNINYTNGIIAHIILVPYYTMV
jgi:cyclic dehypoxanthinyl futalosine synthase